MSASAKVASSPSSTTGRRLLNRNTPKSSVLDSIDAGATSGSTMKSGIAITHLSPEAVPEGEMLSLVHWRTFFDNIGKPARDSVNTATKNRGGQYLWNLAKNSTQMDVTSQKVEVTGKPPFSQRNMKFNRHNRRMLEAPSFQIRPTYSCDVSIRTTCEVVQDGTECR